MPIHTSKTKLNSEQQEAVSYNSGPLLIVAGAGTGKTTVIVEKIKHLLAKKLATPQEILALTFTEKAAQEMEERVDQAMPYGYFQLHISTFHSFADQILRREIVHIGQTPSYKLLTTAENIIFLRKNLFAFNLKYFRPLGNPIKFLDDLLSHFSRLRDEDIGPKEYLLYAKKQQKNKSLEKEEKEKILELAKAYDTYQRLKIKTGYLDFSDLIYYTLELFRTRKNVLARYRKQFRYILVDEFQDTNIAQYLLMKLLAPPAEKPHLTVVGDDSQAIYKFRGASVSNILSFMKDYKKAKQITLAKNYRSIQPILDASYRLIKFNDPDTLEAQLGISKKLAAVRKSSDDGLRDHYRKEVTLKGKKKPQTSSPLNDTSIVTDNLSTNPVTFNFFSSANQEADFVAKEIIKLRDTYLLSQIAILARANSHLTAFTRALSQQGILYQFHGPSLLFKQDEIRDLIAYLNILTDLEDSVSLFRVLSMDILDISERDVALLLAFSRRVNLSLYHGIEAVVGLFGKEGVKRDYSIYKKYSPAISANTVAKLEKVLKMIQRHLKLKKSETAGQILYYFMENTGYLPKLVTYNSTAEEKRALNISRFFSRLRAYESEHEDASVSAIADFIKTNEELGESPLVAESDKAPYEAVHMHTVHSAKGLEFPVVFLTNLVAGRFPTYERAERIPIPEELIKETLPVGDYHIEEERRLFYVGSTRAANRLYLTAAAFYAEGKRERKTSPFVIEMLGEEYIKKEKNILEEEKSQLSIFEYKKKPEIIVRMHQTTNTFSYSQLETFLTCPLQYKLKYILKIPAPQTAAESLGVSVHLALESFYREVQLGKKPNLSKLLDFYRASWVPVGYTSLAHQLKMRSEGEKMLKNYFKEFHNPKLKILDTERPFKIKIADFSVIGKMDRVDQKDGKIEIVDYKTGRKPDDKKIQNNLQLAIYFLAAQNKALYNKRPDKITLTFYFLASGEKVSLTKTAEEVTKIEGALKKIVEEIRTSDFHHRRGPWCAFCPYRDICCYRNES